MGKASRIKQQSAREKIAAQREAARKAERRNRIMITGGSTLLVLVIVAVFIVIKLTQGSTSSPGNTSTTGTLLPACPGHRSGHYPAEPLTACRPRPQPLRRDRRILVGQCPKTGMRSARAMVWKRRLNPATAGEASESTPWLARSSTSSACTANTYRWVSPAGGAAPPNALTP